MNIKKFYADFKPELKTIVSIINDHNFKAGFIGGAVREFFLGPGVSIDFDCELRPHTNNFEFIKNFSKLMNSLEQDYQVESLNYNVFRLSHAGFECEFSLPREEFFLKNFSHSNFRANFIEDRDYSLGFKRRDFTINAIMLEVFDGEVSLIDPLDGRKDLKNKILRACSLDFNKDPVRFLRAVRFQALLSNSTGAEFKLDENILKYFKKISYKNLPAHYIKTESKKSKRELYFFNKLAHSLALNHLVQKNTLTIDNYDREVSNLKMSAYLENAIFLSNEFISWAQALAGVKVTLPPEMDCYHLESMGDENLKKFYPFLKRQSDDVLNFYFREKITDVDSNGINFMKELVIDVKGIDKDKRRGYQVLERRRIYFENYKN